MVLQEYFKYYNEEINPDNSDVQNSIARFVSGVINPDLGKFNKVEKTYFKLMDDTFSLTTKEKYDLMENKDRLVPSDIRKADGEYFTPEPLASYGRNVLKEYIDFKDYYIWDVSCGTGNLFRSETEYDPKKVFLSTLNEADIDLIRDTGFYPDEVNMFACDFLSSVDYDSNNTPFLDTLPEELQTAIRNNEKILFYFNPPFKSSPPENAVSRWMKELGMGRASLDLYTQFIFKVVNLIYTHNLTNAVMGVFSPQTYIRDNTGLYTYITKYMDMQEGIIFNSSDFSDTSKSQFWGVACVIYTHKDAKVNKKGDQTITRLRLNSDNSISKVSEMPIELFAIKNRRLNDWARSDELDYFVNSRAYSFFYSPPPKVLKASVNSFAYVSYTYEVMKNGRVAISTKPISFQSYIDVTPENFFRAILLFGAARVVTDTSDFGMNMSALVEPETDISKELLRDLVIFSLFDLKSFPFATRVSSGGVENVRNTMFFLDEKDVLTEAEKCGCQALLDDYKQYKHKNTIYHSIIKPSLDAGVSAEALDLYNYCKDVLLSTIKDRHIAPEEYHLNAWDAGWVQVRYLLKELKDVELEKGYFTRLIAFKEKLAPRLIELGVFSHVV